MKLILFALSSALTLLCSGCNNNAGGKIDTVKANKVLLTELGKLDKAYLAGDAAKARSSLLEGIRLLENVQWVSPPDKGNYLFLMYSRLYVFQYRMKEKAAAEATWIKLRYWCLMRFERSGLDIEQVMKKVDAFTPERIIEIIESADCRDNNGKLANYFSGGSDSVKE